MEVSSPASRPSPTGGLRPALPPAAGTTLWPLPGGSSKQLHHKIPTTGVPTQSGEARLRWREDFQGFYDQPADYAEEYLRRWCYGAKRSRLQPIKDFVTTVENHWDGIIAWHTSRLSNGLLDAINSLVQAAKSRARGYRNKQNMLTIIYLTAAKLPLPSLANPTPAYMPARA